MNWQPFDPDDKATWPGFHNRIVAYGLAEFDHEPEWHTGTFHRDVEGNLYVCDSRGYRMRSFSYWFPVSADPHKPEVCEPTHIRFEGGQRMNPPPKVTIVPVKGGRTLWKLEKDYFYEWEHNGSRYRFKIPKGFQSDGASVPWFLPWGRGSFGVLPPLVHDYLIHRQGWVAVDILTDDVGWDWLNERAHTPFSRRDADRLFFRILREQGVRPRWLRRWAFRLVRLWSLLKGDRY